MYRFTYYLLANGITFAAMALTISGGFTPRAMASEPVGGINVSPRGWA